MVFFSSVNPRLGGPDKKYQLFLETLRLANIGQDCQNFCKIQDISNLSAEILDQNMLKT